MPVEFQTVDGEVFPVNPKNAILFYGEDSLVVEVVDGENAGSVFVEAVYLVDAFEVEGKKSALPIMRMDNIYLDIEGFEGFKDKSGKEGHAFEVVCIVNFVGFIKVDAVSSEVVWLINKVDGEAVVLYLFNSSFDCLVANGDGEFFFSLDGDVVFCEKVFYFVVMRENNTH